MTLSSFVGQKITKIRPMTKAEIQRDGWDYAVLPGQGVVVIELSNGALLYPSCDEEGNGPGALFCQTENGTTGMVGVDIQETN